MATVRLIDVCKHVGQSTILNNINLSMNKGEFMVVVGPSGCGKSTLLRLIAGLESISSGSILLNDKSMEKTPADKRDMAMVFQNYALYPHMTVYQNMAYGLKLRKFAKSEIAEKVTSVAELLHLTPYLDRKPDALSGGQRQRVAMGRAIVRSPSVYLFDEPLSNLDAKLRTQMRHEIRRLHQKFNTTSLYVTHDQTEAMTMADRLLVLNQGIVEQVGTPHELYQTPSTVFVAGFTGHYPINWLNASYDKKSQMIRSNIGIEFGFLQENASFADKDEVSVGIRPEHVLLSGSDSPNAIKFRLEFVDDMGADKLLEGFSVKNGESLNVRISSDIDIPGDTFYVELPKEKLHLFNKKTGKRVGGLNE